MNRAGAFALSLLLVAALLLVAFGAWARDGGDVDPAFAAEAAHLVSVVAPFGPFRVQRATDNEIALGLVGEGDRVVGQLLLVHPSPDRQPRFRSRRYGMQISNFTPDERVVERLVQAAHAVAEQDGGGWEEPVREPGENLWLLQRAALAFAALAVMVGALRRGRIQWGLRLPHLVPAVIQVVLFAYWSLYWPAVREHLLSMGLQLAMAIALDAALSFARYGSWRIGVAPFPVVLSSNLFVWLDPHGVVICLVVAFVTKTFLVRNRRPMLNPSAAGLVAAGVVSYVAPDFVDVGGLFHTMNLAPNMAEIMVLLAILPQLRFRILPVSIGAVAALRMTDNPAVLRPPIILAVALLATDPSTIPETDMGKALFGLFIGFGLVVTSWTLRHFGQIDDFAKVIPIPVANALGPSFDRLGRALVSTARRGMVTLLLGTPAVEATDPKPPPNALFVVAWLVITISPLAEEKPRSFEPALHWNLGTRFVVRDADDVPRCAHNALFCRPFTFIEEARRWTTGGAS